MATREQHPKPTQPTESPSDQFAQLREACKGDRDDALGEIGKRWGKKPQTEIISRLQLAPTLTIPHDRVIINWPHNPELVEVKLTETPLFPAWRKLKDLSPTYPSEDFDQAEVEATTALETNAVTFAEMVFDVYQKLVASEGGRYTGFVNFLNQAGYTEERINHALTVAKQLRDQHIPPTVTKAAEVSRNVLTQSAAEPLLTMPQIEQELSKYLPDKISSVDVTPQGGVGSTFFFADVTEQGDVNIWAIPAFIPSLREDIKLHLYANLLLGIKEAESGDILAAIRGHGRHERFARAVRGPRVDEVIVWGTVAESAYVFAGVADKICSQLQPNGKTKEQIIEALAEEITKPETAENVVGLEPLPGSNIVPYGPKSVIYALGVIDGMELYEKAKGKSVNEILDLAMAA